MEKQPAIDVVKSLLSPWRPMDVKPVEMPPATDVSVPHCVTFTVYYEPMGAPRMTQRDKWKKRPCVERYHAFRDAIRRDCPELPRDACQVAITAYFARTRKSKNHCGDWHQLKPDVDNVAKAVLDALFEQDQQISRLVVQKLWGLESKLLIEVRGK